MKENNEKHSPLPWQIRRMSASHGEIFISAPSYEGHPYHGRTKSGIEIMSDEDYPTKEADAELIVRAVNSHAALVEVCAAMKKEISILARIKSTGGHYESLIQKAVSALALAGVSEEAEG